MARILLLNLLFITNLVAAQESDTLATMERDSSSFSEENQTKVVDPELDLIIPPVGFDTSPYFHGYVNLKKRSAIVLREVLTFGRYEVMQTANNESFYEKNELTFISKTEFVSDHGIEGVYLKLSFIDKIGVPFTRFMVYAGNDYNTLVIDIVYPTEFDLEDDMLKCMKSIKYTR